MSDRVRLWSLKMYLSSGQVGLGPAMPGSSPVMLGSGWVQLCSGQIGSGAVMLRSGRIGSQKIDPCRTLVSEFANFFD